MAPEQIVGSGLGDGFHPHLRVGDTPGAVGYEFGHGLRVAFFAVIQNQNFCGLRWTVCHARRIHKFKNVDRHKIWIGDAEKAKSSNYCLTSLPDIPTVSWRDNRK